MKPTYKIVRLYSPHFVTHQKPIKTGLTLEEAQAHCRRDDTHEEGVWFDGYEQEEEEKQS